MQRPQVSNQTTIPLDPGSLTWMEHSLLITHEAEITPSAGCAEQGFDVRLHIEEIYLDLLVSPSLRMPTAADDSGEHVFLTQFAQLSDKA